MNREIISSLESAGHLLSWYGPTDPEGVSAISRALDCSLPDSFVTFLVEYGGGGLEDFYISNTEDSTQAAGSVLSDTTYYRIHFSMPNHLVVIQRDYDDNPPHCLETSQMSDGECPVVSFCPSTSATTLIADNFAVYYQRFTEPYTIELA